jgi:hypothetical protein
MKNLSYKLPLILVAVFCMPARAVVTGNMSDANVPINTEMVQPLGEFSQISSDTNGQSQTTGNTTTGGAKSSGNENETEQTQSVYEKILKMIGL